ncbi:hypothetical protein NKR23_g9560 [Pleurostoma richardsiae]|uniref:NmrA-like domain-containing protein n=1 Tax=Pleurostoma richardsiae TaxID=41990 RepID=A0AA38VC84_9PEZI|nr:hypothetical protein NKR23_g9560 [Pleurostoma richardsiae]
MVIVAVAGGLGDVGRTIVEEIVRRKDHKIYVISRKNKPGIPPREVPENFPLVLGVDYAVPSEVRRVLREYDINTVISAMNLHWPGAAESQINLIRAAAESGVVRRFIPSEFNIDYSCSEERMPYPPRKSFLQAEEELRLHPQLTYTLIRNGYFMDYLGLPFTETNLHPLYCVLDLQVGKAVLPGDGNQHVVFTHTRQVASCVNELLKLPGDDWPRESAIIGERITTKQLVEVAESITGRIFETSYDDIAALRQGCTTELPSNKACYAYFPRGREDLETVICTMMVGMASGVFDIQGTNLESLLPSLKPILLEPFLRQCWSKAQGSALSRTLNEVKLPM